MGVDFYLKTLSFSWQLYVLTHGKTLKVLAVVVYLPTQSQRFFVDVSFKFSNNRCRYMTYDNFAIVLSPMQRVTGYLLTLQDLIFDVSLDINGQLRQQLKTSRTRYSRYQRQNAFLFYHFFHIAFESGYWFKTFFSLIMLSMVTMCL